MRDGPPSAHKKEREDSPSARDRTAKSSSGRFSPMGTVERGQLEAEEKIKRAVDENARSLNLSSLQLKYIPHTAKNLTNLRRVNLAQNNLEWLSDAVCSAWVHLISLRLVDNNLVQLPDSICSLPALESLDVSRNQLVSLPRSIRTMSTLRELVVWGNSLSTVGVSTRKSGDDDDNEAVEDGSALRLQSLDVGYNRLKEWPELRAFSQVKEIRLGHNSLRTVGKSIAALVNLTTLSLEGNSIEALPGEIGELRQLRSLNVRWNGLRFLPASFSNLGRLKELKLSNNALEDYVDKGASLLLATLISSLSSLSLLHLWDNRLKTLPISNKLTHLVELDVSVNSIESVEEDALEGCCSLKHLYIGSNLLPSLPALPMSLNSLHCQGNKLASLPSKLPTQLTMLNLSHNQIRILPSSFLELNCLIDCKLNGNDLIELPSHLEDGGGCASWTPFPLLTSLNLAVNRLSMLPDWIVTCSKLKKLYLGFNRFLCVPTSIGSLTELHELWLCSNFISDIDAINWDAFSALRVLSLSQNSISSLPHSLSSLPLLQRLDVFGNCLGEESNIMLQFGTIPSSLKELSIGENEPLRISKEKRSYVLQHIRSRKHETPESNGSEEDDIDSIYAPSPSFLNGDLGLPCSLSSGVGSKGLASLHCCHLSPSRRFDIGAAETRGLRMNMQDVMMIEGEFGGDIDCDFFGLFDGHGETAEVAFFASNELGPTLLQVMEEATNARKMSEMPPSVQKKIEKSQSLPTSLVKKCLRSSFLRVNEALRATREPSSAEMGGQLGYRPNISRPFQPKEYVRAGSGWLGVVMERIKDLGGFVSEDGRVMGQLGLSRGLGDFHLHPFITAIPEDNRLELTDEDEFLIMACDGVWDVLSDEEAVEIIRDELDPVIAASRLRDTATLFNSTDNISVLVVRFQTSEKIAEKLLKMGDYSSAIDLSLEWLRMRLRVGDSAGASKALHFLSSMLIEIFEKRRTKEVPLADGDWRCLRWAEKACHENLKIAKRERDNRTQALAKQRIAEIQQMRGEYDKARESFEEASHFYNAISSSEALRVKILAQTAALLACVQGINGEGDALHAHATLILESGNVPAGCSIDARRLNTVVQGLKLTLVNAQRESNWTLEADVYSLLSTAFLLSGDEERGEKYKKFALERQAKAAVIAAHEQKKS